MQLLKLISWEKSKEVIESKIMKVTGVILSRKSFLLYEYITYLVE